MPFSFIRDASGLNTYGIEFNMKPLKYSALLVSGIEQTLTVPGPSGSYLAIFWFEIGGNVFVACNDTAEVQAGSFATTSSDPNPVARKVNAGDVLSFITNDSTCSVWVSFEPISG